jgi:hypothetical protein
MPGLKGAYHRQCLGCHREWSHQTSCEICHEPKTDLGVPADRSTLPSPDEIAARMHPPVRLESTIVRHTSYAAGPVVTFQHAGHARTYGVRCADCHGSESCAGCHDYTAGREVAVVMEHDTCLSCHRQENCGFCHDTAERAPFDHATSIGWPLEPFHASLSCSDCHGPPRHFASPSTACNGCHARARGTSFDHRLIDAGADCIACHAGMTAHQRHGAQRDGCAACHDSQAGGFRLLRGAYPAEFYVAFEPGRYQLCFDCHDAGMLDSPSGAGRTGFRDGDRNLHWLHVNREKGRTCRACHDVHASARPFYIRAVTPLGRADSWLSLDFEPRADGGRCAPGCHRPQTYLRSRGAETVDQRLGHQEIGAPGQPRSSS